MTVTIDLAAAAHDVHVRRALYDISASVVKKKKIVVVTGAGISCSCGIPDFRSSDGLYNMVKERYPDVVMKGRDLFDAALFRDPTSTSVFYSFIAELKKKIDVASPSSTHKFIKTLDAKNRLLRSYTQNIDGLEERVGLTGSSTAASSSAAPSASSSSSSLPLPSSRPGSAGSAGSSGKEPKKKNAGKLNVKEVRNVQLHGDIHRVRCIVCSAQFPCADEHLASFLEGSAPDCPECLSRSEARVARSARAIRVGSLRPAIVLYDEPHPLGEEIGTIQMADVGKRPDLLIIMGTSMKVHGLKQLVRDFAKSIRSPTSSSSSSSSTASPTKRPCKVIFVNKTAPGAEWADVIDYHVAGDTDAWVERVTEDWKKIRPADWEIQTTLENLENGGFKAKKKAGVTGATGAEAKKRVFKKKDENAPPEVVSPSKALTSLKLNDSPPSPRKRRQRSSHYDELNASPSKRQSLPLHPTNNNNNNVLSASERKLLFTETTNHPEHFDLDVVGDEEDDDPFSLHEGGSKMDISVADLSMMDMQAEVLKDMAKSRKPTTTVTKAKASKGKSKTSPTPTPAPANVLPAALVPQCTPPEPAKRTVSKRGASATVKAASGGVAPATTRAASKAAALGAAAGVVGRRSRRTVGVPVS